MESEQHVSLIECMCTCVGSFIVPSYLAEVKLVIVEICLAVWQCATFLTVGPRPGFVFLGLYLMSIGLMGWFLLTQS